MVAPHGVQLQLKISGFLANFNVARAIRHYPTVS